MTMDTIHPTDADLLSRYRLAGDEAAFATLVRAHERLVIGTAARVTGDAESARDVAQQVFATLAQKAWMLTDRTSLAGWLHHAARHIALRMSRSEAARNRRHEKLTIDNPTAPENDVWPMLEEALATLPDAEREAVVMHHLQDRSYAEMAVALGLTEAAARKRVSRGIQNLGSRLRKRGFGGSAAALLAGAAALQMGTPTVAVAATFASTVPLSLTLTTLMAHTAVKVAAVVTLIAAVPVALQSHANSNLRAELAALEKQTRPAGPTQRSMANGSVDAGSSAMGTERRILNERIASARLAQSEAAAQLAKTQASLKQLEEEFVISHGTVEELARSFVKGLMPLVEAMKAMEQLDETERAKRESELTIQLVDFQKQLRPLVKAMCQLEDRPEDISRVQAFIFEEILGLDSALKQSVESTLVADFQKLKKDGLISSLRPKEKAEAWLAQRQAASMAMEQHLRALLPPEMLEHPMFESGEGLLLDLTTDELTFLNDDAKATPPPAATKP
jgi:RNA polymerase sigma-70 factor (ECF subfamily)